MKVPAGFQLYESGKIETINEINTYATPTEEVITIRISATHSEEIERLVLENANLKKKLSLVELREANALLAIERLDN
jgi:predicted type IV restriction endonuclease